MAQRPASRGMGMGPPQGARLGGPGPVVVKGAGPAPLGTQMRPPTGSANLPPGMRPPTSSQRPPTGSAPMGMRPPTNAGRLGTAMGGGQVPIVPLKTDVDVAARPVTQQGLTGMSVKNLGPSRQIADKNYYLIELRNKLTEITNEVDSMRGEIEKINNNHQTHSNLERKYDTIMKEVRLLEGQLADFNLALDKLRTNTNIGEINEAFNHMRQRNEMESKNVDDIFLKAQSQEKAIKEIENQISTLHAQASERMLDALGEDKQQEYNELQEENNILNEAIAEKERRLNHLEFQVQQAQDGTNSHAYKLYQHSQALKKEIDATRHRNAELEDEVNSQLSPQEIKNRLTDKTRETNEFIADLESKIKNMEKYIEKQQDHIREKESQLVEARKHASKSAKYEAIYEREKKMTEFLENYPQEYNTAQNEYQSLQTLIVDLLKHISKGIDTSSSLSSVDAEKLNEMKAELSFKEEKMKNSAETLAVLKKDLEKREEELEKIVSLDSKISLEIGNLKEKMTEMRDEMATFKTEDELKDYNNEQKKKLLQENARAKKQRENLKFQVAQLSQEYEKKSSELRGNEIYKSFESLEKKLQTYAQATFTLQEFIDTRKRESDYETLLKDCSALTSEMNGLLVQQHRK